MKEKTCFKCEVLKPLTDYYKHKKMADGHLNKCKECTKKDSIANRNSNIDKYREYDRNRGSRQGYEYIKEYRSRFPNKYAAHTAVNNAVRKGVLVPQSCQTCGSKDRLEAHHDDYSKQLDVRWLCSSCHSIWHRDNGPALNG